MKIFTILLAVLSLNSFGLENGTYTGLSYEYERDEEQCSVMVKYIKRDDQGKIISFSAKIDKGSIFFKNVKPVYEVERNNGKIFGYSNAPKESFAGYDGELELGDYVRSFGHLFLSDTFNIELDGKGNLLNAEYFPYFAAALTGSKERLCEISKE